MQMKTAMWVSGLLAGCVALGIQAGEAAPKQEKPKKVWQQLRPERVIGDNVMLYVAAPNLAQARTAFEHTALRGLLNEDEIGLPLLSAVAKLREAYIKGDGLRTDIEQRRRSDEADLLRQLAPLLDGQAAVAIESADTAAGARSWRFLVVASMSSEDRQRELEAAMEKHRYGQTAADAHFLDFNERAGNYDVSRIENTELGVNEAWAFVENLFIYGQGKRVVEEAVERYSVKNSAGSLALHNGYQSAYREVGRDDRGGDSALYLQLDLGALARRAAAQRGVTLPALPEGDAFRPQLALGIQAAEGENAPIKEKLLLRVPKELLPKSNETCKALTARFAQSDALFYNAAQFKLSDLYAAAAPLKTLAPVFGAAEQQLRTLLGVQTDAELLNKLNMFKGECAAFVSYVPQAAAKTAALDFLDSFQLVFAVELNSDLSKTEFNDLMSKIESATKQTYVSAPMAGAETFRYQKGAAPREERDARASANPLGLASNLFGRPQDPGSIPFFLGYAQAELEAEAGAPPRKFLLLSDNYDALRKAVNQTRAPRTSLAEDIRFKDMLRSFRASRFNLGFAELSKVVDIYGAVLPNISRQDGLISRETANKLPTASTLRAHVSPMAWCVSLVSDPDGVLVQTTSPAGNLPLAGLVGLVSWPVLVEREAEAVSQEVDARFKRIMLGLQLYAADFDRYPLQLSELVPSYVKDLKSFESPFRRGAINSAQDIDNAELSNLVYRPGHSLQDLGGDVLVYEKDPTRMVRTRDGMQLYYHVVTVDGKKNWLTRQALDLRLAGKVDYMSGVADAKAAPASADTKKKTSPKR